MHIDILRRLRDAVRRKRLANWRNFRTMLQRTGRFGQEFRRKEQLDITGASPPPILS